MKGQLSIRPSDHPDEAGAVSGELTGTVTPRNGAAQERKLALGDVPKLGKPVSADPERSFEVSVVDTTTKPPRTVAQLTGNIPRDFWNRFEAPPDEDYLLELHRQLGKFHELAMTFTMIAGLLNILVILDAVEGPAYGYGDVDEEKTPNSPGRPPRPPDPTSRPFPSEPSRRNRPPRNKEANAAVHPARASA